MSLRRVEFDRAERLLRVFFPYDREMVELIRSVPGRSFQREGKHWTVPLQSAARLLHLLVPHGFEFSSEVLTLTEEKPDPLAKDVAPPPPEPLVAPERKAFTVGEINRMARQALRRGFPMPAWVVGEVAGYDKGAGKRHLFFELIEKAPFQAAPIASVPAVIFEDAKALIQRRIHQSPEPFVLRDGLDVKVRVRVELWETYGRYQLIVEDMDPSHSLGKLALARLEILRALEREGIRGLNQGRPLPLVPLRVGLITSAGSDGQRDFLSELELSGHAFQVLMCDVMVQGPQVEHTVLQALERLAGRAGELDVIAIVRGGGGRSDLSWFDSLALGRAVARHPVKVITGIGHTRDSSVVDEVALCTKTPTAAAQLLVSRVNAALATFDSAALRLAALAQGELARGLEGVSSLAEGLQSALHASSSRSRARMASLASALALKANSIALTTEAGLSRAQQRLGARSLWHLRLAGEAVTRAVRGLDRAGQALGRRQGVRLRAQAGRLASPRLEAHLVRAGHLRQGHARRLAHALSPLRQAGARLKDLEARAQALDPARTLAKGYVRLHHLNGQAVESVRDLRPGITLRATLKDGHALVIVEEVHDKETKE